MKLSKEARIGILVAASIVIFCFGFYFLKGLNVFSGQRVYYCVFNNVRGLQNQANVEIKGLNVGSIGDTKLTDSGVRVSISLHKNIDIPKGTTATLATADLFGAKVIKLTMGKGPGILKPGATLNSSEEAGMIENVTDKVTPILYDLKTTISYLDTAVERVNALINAGNRKAIEGSLASIKTTTDNLATITTSLSKQNKDITGIVHNTSAITATLAKSNDNIQQILTNLKNISGQLANSPIEKTFTELKNTLTQLDEVMTKINKGEGSAGMLVNDKTLYTNVNSSVVSLKALLDDLKAHPKRYINISVFGGRSK